MTYRDPAENAPAEERHPLIVSLERSYAAANDLARETEDEALYADAWSTVVDIVAQLAAKQATNCDSPKIMKLAAKAVKTICDLQSCEYGNDEANDGD